MSSNKFLVVVGMMVLLSQQAGYCAPVEKPVVKSTSTAPSAKEQPVQWKTYKNESGGFEIQIPESWTAEDHDTSSAYNTSKAYYRVMAARFESQNKGEAEFTIHGFDRPEPSETFQEHIVEEKKVFKGVWKDVKIGNETWIEQNLTSCEDTGCEVSFTYYNKVFWRKGFEITLTERMDDSHAHSGDEVDHYLLFKKDVDLARQILSTLKFVE